MIMPTDPATCTEATEVAVDHHVSLHIAHFAGGASGLPRHWPRRLARDFRTSSLRSTRCCLWEVETTSRRT